MNPTTETICEYCNEPYQKETYDFKRTKRNFCSKKCRGLADRNQIKIECANCGEVIYMSRLYYDKTKEPYVCNECFGVFFE